MAPGLVTLLRYLRPHRWVVAVTFLLLLVEVATDLLRPWPLKFVIDFLAHPEGSGAGGRVVLPAALRQSLPLFLATVSSAIILIAVVEGLAGYAGTYLRLRVAGEVAATIRCQLFAHVQRLALGFHYARSSGELVNRVLGDIRQLESFLADNVMSMVEASITLVGMLAILLWMDWRMTLIAFVLGPLVFWVTVTFTRNIRSASRAQRVREGNLAAIAQETLSAIEIVKAYCREPFSDALFGRQSAANLSASLTAARLEAKFAPVVRGLMSVGIAGIACVGVLRVREGVLSPGDLWIFLSYLRGLRGPIKDLAKDLRATARTQVRWERVTELLETAPPADLERAAAPRFAGEVTIRDVDFGYADGVGVLRGVSLDIQAGERVAVIGPTGAGKSTLVRLIAALHEPAGGSVAIDGHDLRTLRSDSVREQIAFVLQDTVLFRTTLLENIRYGRLDATFEEVVVAARAARIHDFILTLPKGYETMVGERGATLSGGQRQRIAIARALLRNARILILDEPTTGLDPDTGREVWEQIKILMEGRTTILISHQRGLARDMDRVYQLTAGRLVEAPHAA